MGTKEKDITHVCIWNIDGSKQNSGRLALLFLRFVEQLPELVNRIFNAPVLSIEDEFIE